MQRLDEYVDEVREEVEAFINGTLFMTDPESPLHAINAVIEMSDGGERELTQYEVTAALAILSFAYEKFVGEPDFWTAIVLRLREDAVEWGDTWRKRSIKGQTRRTMNSFKNYTDKLKHGEPDPSEMLLRAAGNMFICLVRFLHRNSYRIPDN